MHTQYLPSLDNVVFCADLHLHEHADYARILPSGRNSRLEVGVQCWKQAVDLANGGVLAFAGDLFHDRRSLQISVIDAAMEAMEYARQRCSAVLLLAGNHDQYLRDGRIHSLRIFKKWDNVHVADAEPVLWTDGNRGIYAHPFAEDAADVVKWAQELAIPPDMEAWLLLHQGMRGARMNGGALDTTSASPRSIVNRFKYILLGHYHKPQALPMHPNVMWISSPYQLNWGESGDVKRFLRLQNNMLESIPVTGAPEFRRVKLSAWMNLSEVEQSSHFYEVVIPPGAQVALPPGAVGVPEDADSDVPDVPTGATFDINEAICRWAIENYPDELWLADDAKRYLQSI